MKKHIHIFSKTYIYLHILIIWCVWFWWPLQSKDTYALTQSDQEYIYFVFDTYIQQKSDPLTTIQALKTKVNTLKSSNIWLDTKILFGHISDILEDLADTYTFSSFHYSAEGDFEEVDYETQSISTYSSIEQQAKIDIDIVRKKYGLLPLRSNSLLNQIAYDQAQYILDSQNFGHIWSWGSTVYIRADWEGYTRSILGETLGMYVDPPWSIVKKRENSPWHAKIMLHSQMTELGISYIDENDIRVAVFGTR